MNLQELKCKTPAELLAFAEELQIENASTLRKQDMMFAILKQLADNDVPIFGDGVASRCSPQQATEAGIRCRALNIMTHQGMPRSEQVAA